MAPLAENDQVGVVLLPGEGGLDPIVGTGGGVTSVTYVRELVEQPETLPESIAVAQEELEAYLQPAVQRLEIPVRVVSATWGTQAARESLLENMAG